MKKIIINILLLIPVILLSQEHQEQRAYEYDNLNRLVKVVFNSGIIYEYNYDNLGNRLGKTIDVELPFDNYTLNTIGLTCINSNDGIIHIEAEKRNTYNIEIDSPDNNYNNSFLLSSGNDWILDIDYLEGGEYFIYITINGIPENIYKKTFILNLDEPEPLEVAGRPANNGNMIDIDFIHGTAPFTVTLNGETIAITSDSSFQFEAKHGDVLEITSSKACEGKYKEVLNIANAITMYPNPTEKMLFFTIPSSYKEDAITIKLFDTHGKQVGSFSPQVQNGKVEINIESLPSGVYIAKIPSANNQTFKIIKQ